MRHRLIANTLRGAFLEIISPTPHSVGRKRIYAKIYRGRPGGKAYTDRTKSVPDLRRRNRRPSVHRDHRAYQGSRHLQPGKMRASWHIRGPLHRKSDPFGLAPFDKQDPNHTPFLTGWEKWRSFGNLHFLYRSQNCRNTYAVIYVHSVLFYLPSRCTIAGRYNLLYKTPEQLDTVPQKIRYYRHKHLLHQEDVAKRIDLSRKRYILFEAERHDYYPIEVLEKLARVYHIPIENLMDDYHLFLYQEPGKVIKQFRKKQHYTQQQLADMMGVWKSTVRNWEGGRCRITKENYTKFMELKRKSDI